MTALSQKISLSVQSSCCYRLTPKISAPFRRSGSFPSLIFERALTPARLCGHLGVTHRNSLSKRAKATIVMVLTESKTMEIGTRAPPFQLPEPLTGKQISLEEAANGAPALLVMFICNHCPFVKILKEGIVSLTNEYQGKGLASVAISANSIKTHPQDGPEHMANDAKSFGYPFPYLYDESQEVAKAYKAACTPEFYVFAADTNQEYKLAYHGQFDSARPGNGKPVTGEDLRAALDDILAGKQVQRPINPSIGCNVKWHPE